MVRYLLRLRVNVFLCLRCGHYWVPRVDLRQLLGELKEIPRSCPRCKSIYWTTKKKKPKRRNNKNSLIDKNLSLLDIDD